MNDGLADATFKPLIARTFSLGQIVEAHRFLESNQQMPLRVPPINLVIFRVKSNKSVP